jgi:hypothetical protein
MAVRGATLIAVAIAALAGPADALAHGPCGCTFPTVVEPGQSFRTGPAYKVVWNPAPRDFRDQTTPVALASGYRAGAPTAVLLQRPRRRPLRHAPVRAPRNAPPGLYFVLIFDGEEGGAHTTWDYVQVGGRPSAEPAPAAVPQGTTSDDGNGSGSGSGTVVAVGVAGLLAGAAGGVLAGRRGRRRREAA